MGQVTVNDPILSRFQAAVRQAYGSRVERVLLFGSRARGDWRPDSDYDIAVFLTDMPDRAAEMNRLADIGTDILYEAGAIIHAVPYRAKAFDESTPLMHEIRSEGIEL